MSDNVVVYGGGGGCFPAGVMVSTPYGDVDITELSIGDEVLSYDYTGRIGVSTVQQVHVHDEDTVITAYYWGGSLRITANHWVLNQYNAFVAIGTLTEHDALVDSLGHLRPILHLAIDCKERVYNLTVTPDHTFIADGIRVHNGGRGARLPVVAGSGGGGGKGGGGSARAAVEDADSIHSKQYARVLDALCEGEIVGLIDGAKSIYLNDTPLQAPGGAYNFAGVTWYQVTGQQVQGAIPGFSSAEVETSVGVEIQNDIGTSRSITNPNIDRVRITVGIPRLTLQDTTTGDLHGNSVSTVIHLNAYDINGAALPGGPLPQYNTITGKTTSRYQRSYNITLYKPVNAVRWTITIYRAPKPVGSNNATDIYWDSYTEITDAKLRYPNTAAIGLQVDAEHFSTVPTRAYHVRLLIVRVPTNYDPVSRTYTGIWNGTFKLAWTNNPAWCLYDLITSKRYGLGRYVAEAQVDKWAFYEIGRYCDIMVPDGFGGTEPRMTLNVYLQTREEAIRLISDLASVFRGMVYWGGGSVTTVQDSPKDATYLFTPSNVIDGEFVYSGTDRRKRHTVALVTWNDPADFNRQKVEYVEDEDGIRVHGVVQTEVYAIGCTSRGQAHRVGKWILYSDLYETETVSFKVGMEGATMRPGNISKIQDPMKSVYRLGGRVLSGSTASTIIIDAPADGSTESVTLVSGHTYELSCVRGPVAYTSVTALPNSTGSGAIVQLASDGALHQDTVGGWVPYATVETRTLSFTPGVNQTVLYPATAFSFIPQANAVWVLSDTSLEGVPPRPFRVLSVAETARNIYEVSALLHNPSKFDAIELGLQLETPNTRVLNVRSQDPVTGVVISEYLYKQYSGVMTMMSVAWNTPTTGVGLRYTVRYRVNNSNYTTLPETAATMIDIPNVVPGEYTVVVTARNAIGVQSPEVSASQTIWGKRALPADVTGFLATRRGRDISFMWTHIPDLDRDYYEVRFGTVWDTAVPLIQVTGNTALVTTHQGGSFLIKAYDTSGNPSRAASLVSVADLTGINVVVAREEGNRAALDCTLTGSYMSHPVNGFDPAAKSIEMWMCPDWTLGTTLGNNYYVLWCNGETGDAEGVLNGVELYVTSQKAAGYYNITFSVTPASGITHTALATLAANSLVAGFWYHIVATYDAAGINIYINGVNVAYTAGPIPLPTANLGAFNRLSQGGTAYPGRAKYDDVRIYNRVLSGAEVLAHYGSTFIDETGLVACWPANEGSGTSVFDVSSSGNTGSLVAGTVWNSPGHDMAWLGTRVGLRYDGSGVLTLPPIHKVSPSPHESIVDCSSNGAYLKHTVAGFNPAAKTIELRVCPDWSISSDTGTHRLWDNGDLDTDSVTLGAGKHDGVSLWISNIQSGAFISSITLKIRSHTAAAITLTHTFTQAEEALYLRAGVWSHVVAAYSAAGMALYINGVLIASLAGPIDVPTINYSTSGRIGSPMEYASVRFGDSRIYNRAISPVEVLEHYTNVYTDDTGLVGHWAFSEGTGPTAADTSGQNNTATLLNGASWGYTSVGTYTTNVLDLGRVIPVLIELTPTIEQINIDSSWNSMTQPWESYTAAWYGVLGTVSASFEIRTAIVPGVWGAWTPFIPGGYTARQVQIRATLASVDPAWVGKLSGLKLVADVEDRIVHKSLVAIASGGTTIPITPPFVSLQTAQVSIQAGVVGDNYVLSNKGNAAITVRLYDGANNPKAGIVDVDFFGYGEVL